jgi:DNA polymerase-3 subunit epsilon
VLSGDALAAAGYAVVDVETTGSSSRRHRIVELAVVQLDRERRVEGEFATLIDPEGPVGPTHIHGIEPGDLLPAPRFWQVADELAALLRGRVLVGHNVGCDRAFLAAEYARIGVTLPAVPQVCTMKLAERFATPRAGLSLRACAEAAGLPGWPEHTALGDARVAGVLFTRYAAAVPGGVEALARAGRGSHAAVEWPRMPLRSRVCGAAWVGRTSGTFRTGRTGVPGGREGNEGRRSMVSATCRGGA